MYCWNTCIPVRFFYLTMRTMAVVMILKGHYGPNGLDRHTQMEIYATGRKLQPLPLIKCLTFHTPPDYSRVRRLKPC